MAFWFPVFIFFGGICLMVTMCLRVINQEAAKLQARAEVGDPDVAFEQVDAPASMHKTPVAGS